MFDIFNPDPSLIDINDIAHALSLTCRFGGHCRSFYSVAQHSVLVAEWMYKNFSPQKCAMIGMIGLLHDAAEAYVGDIPRPIKRSLINFDKMEFDILQMIYEKYGVWDFYEEEVFIKPDSVQFVDDILLSTERRDLMKSGVMGWVKLPPPITKKIRLWKPQKAEKKFINLFNKYMAIIQKS